MEQRGLVHLYCGDGKGKTTAAFGLALRCAGQGGRVIIVQLLKSRATGEAVLADTLEKIQVIQAYPSQKFSFQLTAEERDACREAHMTALEQVWQTVLAGGVEMLVLDELMGAWTEQLIDHQRILDMLDTRPPGVELVLTGRDPDGALVERADYITEMRCLRHPYQRGISARPGIEY